MITVTGSDDAAVIGGTATGSVTEDDADAAQASGTLTVSDPDAGEAAFTGQTDVEGTYGTFALEAEGAWAYTLDNEDLDTDALAAGQTGTDRFTVQSAGGAEAQVVITVTGANDAAVIGGTATGSVTEDDADAAQASGALTVSDPDAGEAAFTGQTDVEGMYGTFTLGANGAWTYTLDNTDPDTDALMGGEEAQDTFTVASMDGTEAQVVITVTGSWDVAPPGWLIDGPPAWLIEPPGLRPIIGGALTGAVTEDAAETEASGTVVVSDPDTALTEAERRFETQTDVEGTYGTFTLGANGGWTYTLDNDDPNTDALAAGQEVQDTFEVASVGGTAIPYAEFETEIDSDTGNTVTVTGSYDDYDADVGIIRIIWGDGSATRAELDEEAKTFTATYTYASDASAFVDDVELLVSTSAQVVVTVTGTDDAAVIGGIATGAVTEDAAETEASGTLTVSDVDTTLTEAQRRFETQADVKGTYGTFTLEAEGAWAYTLDNDDLDTDALAAGEEVHDTFTVASMDGAEAQVVITVTGADDAAVIGGAATGSVTEDDAGAAQARGALTVSDPDTGEAAFTAQADVGGTYGTFTLGADGAWAYTLDNTDSDTDALVSGQTGTDRFTVQSADGTTAQVVITVTGADDAAVIGGAATGSVTEDDAGAAQARGALTVSDPDTGEAAFTAQADVGGTYGTFTLGADGAWRYALDNTDSDTDALAAGETGTDTFTVASVDGTEAQVVVTVTGADDAAVIGGTATGSVTEDDADAAQARGALTVRDPDTGEAAFTAQADVGGTYGTFTLGADGAWRYALDNTDSDTDALAAGETGTDTFTVASVDGTEAQVVVTVTGADDAAVIGGTATGSVTEDAAETEASGTLVVSDPDAEEAQRRFETQADVKGTYGTFTLGAEGAWAYTLDNTDPATDALAAGETGTDTFTVASADGTTAQVDITVTGANDAAVIGGTATGSVTEDDADAAQASGTLTVSDPDGEAAFTGQTDVEGTHGTFTLEADGAWAYTLDNTDPDTDALMGGEEAQDTFTVASMDGTEAQVVITVTGSWDVMWLPDLGPPAWLIEPPGLRPIIGGALTGAVTEDAAETEASGTVVVSDPDTALTEAERRFETQTDVEGTYGTFTLGANGGWTYTLDNDDPNTDALAAGQEVQDTFEVASVGGTAIPYAEFETEIDSDTGNTVTVTGSYDDYDADVGIIRIIWGDGSATRAELDEEAKTFTATYTYASDASAFVDDVELLVSTSAQVVITVTGADDAAVIGGIATGAVTEDAAETEASGTLTVSDVDTTLTEAQRRFETQADVKGTYGTFTLEANGAWAYTLDNTDPATDALAAGQEVHDTFTVASADGTTAQVVITVTGANDEAVIGGAATGSVTEDDAGAAQASGALTVSDPDTGEAAFTAQADVGGTYGTFTLEADGAWRYALDNDDPDTDALLGGEEVQDAFTVASADGTEAQVVITVTGADDAAVIGGTATGSVTEDDADAAQARGTLTVSDPDAEEAQRRFETQADVGTYGTFTLGADGAWAYTLDNTDSDTDALVSGQTGTDRFTVQSADGTTAQVVITVTGANDEAVIGGTATGSVTEDDAGAAQARGALTVSDPDAGEAAFTGQTDVEGMYGTFTLEADGAWAYTLDNTDSDTDALVSGQTGTDRFTVQSADGTTAQVVITVTGADDAAVIGGAATGSVTEDDADAAQARGALTVSDPDTGEAAFTAQADVGGTYGTFTLEADGAWRYALDNTDSDTDALVSGQTGTDRFTVQSADGTTAQVVITVTGADDAAVIGGAATGSVTEDDAGAAQARGALTVSDPDTGEAAFTAQADVGGTYGTFTLGADGAWRYALDNTDSDTDALAAGETGTDTFTVASVDGTEAQVVVTVTGADDAAVIGGTATGSVTEDDADAAQARGALTVRDPDTGEAAFTAQADVGGTYGTFTLEADGAWAYTLDNTDSDTDALVSGQTGTDRFTVQSADGTEAQVVITVTGANDEAVIGGTATGSVTEDDAGAAQARGALTVRDPDAGEAAFTGQTDVEGTYGTFTLEAEGAWAYTLDNEDLDTDALAAGEEVHDTFTVASMDGAEAQVVITVTGANDAAVIGGPLSGEVTEDDADAAQARGALTVSDPDAGEAAFTGQTDVEGMYGTFTLEAEGAWAYTLDNDDLDTDALAAGEEVHDTFTVASMDGAEAQVVITVTGADDAAVIGGAATGSVTEDDAGAAQARGALTVSDPDTGEAAFTAQADVGGTYGTFTLGADGAWAYTLDNTDSDTDALVSGQTGTDRFTVQSADGTTAQVVITVTGADDAAVIGGAATGSVTEDDAGAAQARGALTVSDPDTGEAAFTAQADVGGTYGTFTLGADGAWRYALDNTDSDTDALAAGETGTDTFTVASVDGTEAQVVVTVTGADDAAVIGGTATGSVTEDDADAAQARGALTVRDPDTGEAAFTAQADVGGTYGTFTLGADGAWRYALDNTDSDTDALAAGETGTDTFTVASVDGTEAQVVVTVTGADDAAVIGGTATGSVTEDAAETEASGTLVVSDPDAEEAQRRFETQADVKGTYGTFTLGAEGAWAYTLDNTDPATDALAAGETGTDTFTVASADGTTAQVDITVTGANDAAVIGGTATGSVTEDDADAAQASGTLTVSDPDGEAAFTGQTDVEGTHGTFTLEADGAWAYTLDNTDPDTDALMGGEEAQDTFTVASMDGTEAQVVITVTGSWDVMWLPDLGPPAWLIEPPGLRPIIGGALTGAVTEDAAETEASGTVVVSDPDTALTEAERRFETQTDVEGTYGTFTLGANGGWTYTLDNDDPNTDALAAGQEVQDTFEVASVGGTAIPYAEFETEIDSDTGNTVTVTGSYDDYDADVGIIRIIWGDGSATRAELDEEAKTFTATYTYASDASAFVDDVELLVSTSAQVVITVTGADDAAVIGGIATGAVTEDAAETEASGTLTVSDVDTTLTEAQRRFETQADVKGTYGTFTLEANGAWAYTLDNTDPATDALAAGQEVHDTFTVASADGTTAQVVITVTGANDEAVIGGAATGSVTEDDAGAAQASGALTVSDPDTGEAAFTAQADVGGTYGTFTLEADGAWRYALDNDDPDTDALLGGEEVQDAFTVASADGTEAQVVITVTGADDAAVIGGTATGSVTEDDADAAQARGTLTVSDPDAEEAQRRFETQADVGTYGTFTLGADGAWAYTLDNTDSDTDALVSGQTGTDRFTVQSADGTTAQVVITVTGANDEAVIGGTATGSVTEDDAGAAQARGALTVSDPDAGEAAFTGQTDVEGMYGTFTLEADGAWAYTLDNTDSDTDALVSGQTGTDRFTVQSADGTTAQVVITVTGADDAAVIGGAATGSVTEDDADAAQARGALTVSDPDTGEAAFTAQADVGGTYGTFTLEADGAWRYALDNTDSDTDALVSGQTGTDRFTVQSADGTTAQVVITVTGADDAAVIGGAATGSVTEDDAGAAQARGALTVSDPDTGEAAFTAQADVGGTYGTFTLGADGAWRYALDNTDSDTDALDTFTVASWMAPRRRWWSR